MQFDPDVVHYLEALKAQRHPPLTALTPDQARQLYRESEARDAGPHVEVAEVRDLSVPGPAGPIRLRLYRPADVADRNAPTLIFIHGGGFVLGDLDTHDGACRRLAVRAACKVIAIEYRLAPEHPAPAASEDVAAALHRIAAEAGPMGIDLGRLAVAGDSAGGGLAAVAAIIARDAGMALRCQVLAYPSIDNRSEPPVYSSRKVNRDVPPLLPEALAWANESYLQDKRLGDEWRQSPILADLAGLAPALVVIAERDPLRSEGLAYADALELAEVEVSRLLVPEMIHGFLTKSGVFAATDRVIGRIAEELKQRFL